MESAQFSIPEHILKLQEFDEFYKLNLQLRIDYGTQERAYEAAERIYSQYFGKTRYKNFETYRQLETRHNKKLAASKN